ncbi:MAG: TIGR04283 family arsenosugar biosynthesis glycosyltransferase [Gammaproteobacteria bacterium]|nr:TIGR04283 family arsenosugar biosynthesis glycosyltransferase [Gammaproteobacteria bacterium]
MIPVLNESRSITPTLMALQPFRRLGHEIILVDGGSSDDTLMLAEDLVDQIIGCDKGRARQMNYGARHAWGNILLFLHADTTLPDDALEQINLALKKHEWGRFNVRLSGGNILLRFIERMMNWRSCVSGVVTGDQAIFMPKSTFIKVGGFADIPLMEDIELSKRLKKIGYPACVKSKVITSSRRWEENGIIKTILLMWQLRYAYYRGVKAEELVKRYYP